MTNEYSKKIASLFLILMLAIASVPIASYADNDRDDDKREEKKEKVEKIKDKKEKKSISTRACRQLFFRLFTVGTLRNNENVNLFIECLRPLGFEARFVGQATTTPPTTPPTDTVAPVISNIRTQAAVRNINVTWNTDENATSRLYYSTSTGLDVNATSTSFVENTNLRKNHSLALSNLAATTTYYMAIESKDGSNNKSLSPVFTTTTTVN